MFRRSDFKRLQVLGSGKKNTKIYKAIHLTTGQVYALKQVQAKNFDKLNQYKQQAVQLMKIQNHPNIMRSFGYYLSQTKYNSYKLGIVTQYMDGQTNLQYLYRKRKKQNLYWTQEQLIRMYCSMVSTCSFLQSKGICHRDIKPANLFVTEKYQFKLIDFGESKDYFYDPTDEERDTFTMATIRGTPQYLSPILWKAHVIDGSSRFAEHNIYKSDVFSSGLVLIQCTLMAEVTGFNSKTLQVNGQKLIRDHLKIVQKMYSSNYAQLLGLLLKFQQSDRPSFCQIQALFYQKQLKCRQQNKPLNNHYIRFYNQQYNNFTKSEKFQSSLIQHQTASLKQTFQVNNSNFNTQPVSLNIETVKQKNLNSSNSNNNSNLHHHNNNNNSNHNSHNQIILNQAQQRQKIKQNYYKDSTLMLHQSCYWFQFGGSSIGRFSINRLKWKIDNGGEKKFPLHFAVVFIPTNNSYFLLGGSPNNNFLIFQQGKKIYPNKYQMPTFRNFFSTVYYAQKVYVFGGYDGDNKIQIKTCEYYDIVQSKWRTISDMKVPRSQSAACRINDQEILICGGYNKQLGTIDTIERYVISKDKFQLLSLKLPIPLRRFMIVRVANNKALILGGLTLSSKQSQRVFKLDYQKFTFTQLQNLQKGGVIQNQILVDGQGNLHIFLQHSNGTSPHSHIKYPYDPTKQQTYQTKQF